MSARIEIRAYTDGWLHCYQREDFESGRDLVTPGCAETAAFYPVDHERNQISAPPTQAGRAEYCPGCLTWAHEHATAGPVPVPLLAGVFRGVL